MKPSRRASPYAALVCGVLAGCAGPVDDPKNVPEFGAWTIRRIAGGLSLNGRRLAHHESGDTFRSSGVGLPDGDFGCMEPNLTDKARLASYVSRQLQRKCTVTKAHRDGARISGQGDCGEGRGAQGGANSAHFTYSASEEPNMIEVRVRASIKTAESSGETNRTSVAVKIEGKRAGICDGKAAKTNNGATMI